MTLLSPRISACLALAALAALGCAHPSTRSIAMSAQTSDENKRNVQKLFDTFNHADLGPLEELVSPDYVGAQGEKGPASFRVMMSGLHAAFPDIRYTIDEAVAESDRVAVRWHWTGTHQGPFRGFPATGNAVSNSGAGIFRLANGKIVAASLETDRLGFLEQIGVVPEGVGRGPRPSVPPAASASQ